MNPIYAIDKDYLENARSGPFFQGEIPSRTLPSEDEWVDFLGFKVATPIGVPAGPLLNANWVLFAAKMGFDVVTYKTIRSAAHPAHPRPNMVYVAVEHDIEEGQKLYISSKVPKTLRELAATNSFGIPSQSPDFLIEDIAKAKAGLDRGQVLIVSVVGTPRAGEDYIEDFAKAALLALEGGAPIIEADLSCPNISGKEGSLYTNPDSVYAITRSIKRAIGEVPLVIKVGALSDFDLIQAVMQKAYDAGAEAICGINTVSAEVLNKDGTPALGESRRRAGVCGGPIRKAALQFIEKAARANTMGMTLMATGGVSAPEHFDDFLDAGAAIAMSAIGMMWDPYIAMKRYSYVRRVCL